MVAATAAAVGLGLGLAAAVASPGAVALCSLLTLQSRHPSWKARTRNPKP